MTRRTPLDGPPTPPLLLHGLRKRRGRGDRGATIEESGAKVVSAKLSIRRLTVLARDARLLFDILASRQAVRTKYRNFSVGGIWAWVIVCTITGHMAAWPAPGHVSESAHRCWK